MPLFRRRARPPDCSGSDDDYLSLRERVARALCAADGLDEMAWRTRLRQADAALAVVAREIERLTRDDP